MKSLAIMFLALTAAASENAPRRFVIIADSHGVLGPFGAAVDNVLRELPGSDVLDVSIGASAPSWFYHPTVSKCAYIGRSDEKHAPPPRKCSTMRSPLASKLLRKMAGHTVVVALGSNLVYDPQGLGYARSSSERLVRDIQAAGARCVWVGPPRMRRFSDAKIDEIYKALRDAMRGDTSHPPCVFLDSRGLTSYPATGGDGVHYNFPQGEPVAQQWGETIAHEIAALATAPKAAD
jgi:hypothetical protein